MLQPTSRADRHAEGPRPGRPGMTLFEILLVLALLVIIGGLTAPMFSGTLGRARLQHGGDLLRAAWGQARLTAMQQGETIVFRYQPEGNRYQVQPLSALALPEAAAGTGPPAGESLESADVDRLRHAPSALPSGVVFLSGQVSAVPQLAAGATGGQTGWSSPILFYADGSTSDAVVMLADPAGATLRVALRGLTGISRASDVLSEVAP